MPTELQLADDYAAALDGIASRATNNTTLALTRSLNRTLRDLRRFYGQFVDPELATTRSADGVMRRPGAYSIADGNAKFRKLIELAQAYLPEAQLAALQRQYLQDFADAVALGGELGQELAQQADPQSKARGPFVGASKAAIEAAANTASAYIRGEVESFRDSLVRIVSDGVGRGKGAKALEREIKEALYGAKDPDGLTAKMGLKQRAELIARSELANAYVGAQKAAASRNGFIYGRWIATKDERTCPVCASRHGKIYRLDEMVGTLHPRCRCSLSPVSTDAVEETDPNLRKRLLREDYWERARDEMITEFAAERKWPWVKASKVLKEAIKKPSPSERRQYPGMTRAPEPIA